MACKSCGKKIKDAIGRVVNNVVSSINGIGVNRAVYEQRMNICRNCGWFKPTTWFCSAGNADARNLCKGGRCKFDNWK